MADWHDQVTTEAPTPPPPAAAGGDWRSRVVPAIPDDPKTGAVDSLVQNAPGMKDAQNPYEGFLAGLQMSASVLPFKRPTLQVPAQAGFMTKLSGAVGQGLGDLPANLLGFFGGTAGGAAAGGAAGAVVPVAGETGVSEAIGAAGGGVAGGGFGTTALPQAVRETMLDYYKDNAKGAAPMTWGDFAHQVAHSAWNVTKAGAVGLVGGVVGGKVAGAVESAGGSAFASNAANVAGFAGGATAAQAAIDHRIPDSDDFAITAITALGFGVAGHYVAGKMTLTPQGEQVAKNAETIYRQTGVPPWEQAQRAKTDPQLRQELLTSDVNGDANPTKFNETRAEDPEPFHEAPDAYKVNAHALQDEHDQHMSELATGGNVDAHVQQLLPMIRGLERSKDDAISPKGAIGRYQIMPGTARQFGFDPEKLMDPAYNEKVARVVLGDLSRRFHGDTEAVLAAYNAGPGRAMKFIRDGRDTTQLPTETQKYLTRAGYGGKGGEPPPPIKPPEPPPENPDGSGPDYTKLSTESLVSRFRDKIGEKDEPPVTGLGGMMRLMASELESARGIDKELQRRGMLNPDKDISTEDMFRQTYASEDRSNYMMLKGNIDPMTLDAKEGPSLIDVLKDISKAGGNMDEYNAYRVASRTLEKSEQGIDVGVFEGKEAEAGAIVQKPEMQKYKAIDAKMQQWKNGGLEYGRDSGLFSQDGMERMQAMNTSHVSIRAITGGDFGPGDATGKGFKTSNPLKRMVGGEKGQIVNPLLADMDNMRQIIRMADRNRAIGHVIMSQDHVKFFGLKKVPNMNATLAEPGSDVFKPYDMTPEEEKTLEPFAVRANGGLMGTNRFLFIRDGKPEVWEAADPNVAQLMRGADSPGEMNVIEKILRLPAMMERAGITAAPDFAFRVPMAHQLTAWVLAPNHPPPYITAIRGMMDAFGHGDNFWELMRRGGLSGSITEGDMAKHVDKALNDEDVLEQTGALKKAWNSVAHPLAFAQMITEKLTQAERIGHFKYMQGSDITPNKVAMQGRQAYLDFSEKGTWVVANKLAQYIPFWRASLLGTRMLRNAVVDHPKQFAMYTGLGLVAPQIALFALNHEADKFLDPKDRYSSLPQWERDEYFITPQIDGTRIKLRRPYTIGPLINVPVERYLESVFDKNPNAFDGLLSSMFSDVRPGMIPQAALPFVEEATNHNFFTGQQLISDRVKEASPDLQYTPETSEISKKISALIGTHQGLGAYNVSPIILDNYVEEWGGSIGMAVLHSLDKPLGKELGPQDWADEPFVKGFVVRNPRMNTQQLDDFYKEAANFEQLNKDVLLERKSGNVDQATLDKTDVGQKATMVYKIERALNVQRKAIDAINHNKEMTVDDKRQLSERIYNDAWQIARMGTNVLRGGAVPGGDESRALSDQVTQDVGAASGKP